MHFFQKSIFSDLRARNGRDFDVGGPERHLKMAITFIPLVPQKTVKYKSCSYWCPETFIKVWQGLKIDILEFILKKLIFGWILDAILDFSRSVSEIVTKNFFQIFFGALDIFGRDLGGGYLSPTKSVSSAYSQVANKRGGGLINFWDFFVGFALLFKTPPFIKDTHIIAHISGTVWATDMKLIHNIYNTIPNKNQWLY